MFGKEQFIFQILLKYDTVSFVCEISGYQGGEYEDDSVLGYSAV
jgi:hypothetical protein